MPNIFHQSIEDILRSASPEQKLLWNDIFLRFGERIAVSQFYYSNVSTGSELSTFTARKIYLAYELIITGGSGGITPLTCYTYNELNVQKGEFRNSYPYWDNIAAAVRYASPNVTEIKNEWFSRIAAGASYTKFIGYRIAY